MKGIYDLLGYETYLSKELSDKIKENFKVEEKQENGLISHMTVPLEKIKEDYERKAK